MLIFSWTKLTIVILCDVILIDCFATESLNLEHSNGSSNVPNDQKHRENVEQSTIESMLNVNKRNDSIDNRAVSVENIHQHVTISYRYNDAENVETSLVSDNRIDNSKQIRFRNLQPSLFEQIKSYAKRLLPYTLASVGISFAIIGLIYATKFVTKNNDDDDTTDTELSSVSYSTIDQSYSRPLKRT